MKNPGYSISVFSHNDFRCNAPGVSLAIFIYPNEIAIPVR